MHDSIEIGSSRAAFRVRGAWADSPATSQRSPGRLARTARRARATRPGRDAKAGLPALPRGFRGELGAVALADEGTLLLGLGPRDSVDASALRRAGARMVRGLERLGIDAIRIDLGAVGAAVGDRVAAGSALGEGMATGNWRVDHFDGAATSRTPRATELRVDSGDPELLEGLVRGLRLGRAVNESRRLAATPPNICTPAWIAAEAKRLAKRTGMTCRVISATEAEKMGMGGLAAVGVGSANPPCLIILEHRPRRLAPGAKGRHIALIGKTLTFDTGGYSLKLDKSMRYMKYDKCGGTAVLGAMQAIAEAKLGVRVTALLPAAENMVSERSYRPDDILTMLNGVTVEVTNTDAEGRLVLGDALAYACRRHAPTEIIDVATLTGGVVVALGAFCAGLFCNDEPLRGQLMSAAERSGERLWHLPLWPEHREFMRSQHADIINSNPKREAHPIQGAAFLSYFVDAEIPWAHLDIAGVATIESPNDCAVAGPTGFGVRLLYEYVEGVAAG